MKKIILLLAILTSLAFSAIDECWGGRGSTCNFFLKRNNLKDSFNHKSIFDTINKKEYVEYILKIA